MSDGRPAARIGDRTAHGCVIVKGEMTVLIGGKPAARVGDIVSPRTPHRAKPIVPPCAPTVLIGGMPAARLGDQVICALQGTDTIVSGCMEVLIGTGGV